MKVIEAKGGFFAVHVGNDENACTRWHGFNFRPWHVGVFAMTRHGITLVGVVSGVDGVDGAYTWWANYRGEFYPAQYRIDSYSAPDDSTLSYQGSYKDFLGCIEASIDFLGSLSAVDYEH